MLSILRRVSYSPHYSYLMLASLSKHTIDYSRVPELKEHELEEKFVRGSGPGGSAVNKNSNCVVLTHKPTGIVVKVHTSRSLDENRRRAREALVLRLDEADNAEWSVAAQRRRADEERARRGAARRLKMRTLREQWMQRDGLK